jgi:4-hydroxy-3-methylbut-2-en-1-yl diphosphate reductase
MEIILAQPRGFCAGVRRAIEIVERALEIYGAPIYVVHEIVHNRHVVNALRARGAVFVETVEEVPDKAVCVFSAHGVATRTVTQAQAQHLKVIDATCPLVTKVHLQAQRYARQDCEVIIIGHAGHPEVEGTRGRIDGALTHVLCSVAEVDALRPRNPNKLAYVTQTTLSLDDTHAVIERLKERFPAIQGPHLSDICYATQNRQNAVRQLADSVDLLLVVGAHNSSNSNRLRETGKLAGIEAHLIDNAAAIDLAWLQTKKRIGISAGASTPEALVKEVLDYLRAQGAVTVADMDGIMENTVFRLPAELLPQG